MSAIWRLWSPFGRYRILDFKSDAIGMSVKPLNNAHGEFVECTKHGGLHTIKLGGC